MSSSRFFNRRLLLVGGGIIGGTVAATTGTFWYYGHKPVNDYWKKKYLSTAAANVQELNIRHPTSELPSRDELVAATKAGEEYDVLVIGGGITGAGVALDAQSRGLKTCMIEYDDYASGTSSRSTKLIHGGVRYLQAAVFNLDIEQYRMVNEALRERANLLEIAPHLSSALPIMLPIYKWWQVPYFWAGIKMYDLVAGRRNVKQSYYIGKTKALELFPMLKKEALKGALIYYDGQHNDSRMCLAVVLSAIRQGAHCINHCKVTGLTKNETGQVNGATVTDGISGQSWSVKSKAVVNATGPFMDQIRMMDDPKSEKLCVPAAGVHITLPGYYSPVSTGLLDPATSDGRVIFFLPWERMTIAGTTDSPSDLTHSPAPSEKDIQFILDEIRHYLSDEVSVRRGDVLSAWAGLRPLVRDPTKKDTKSLARNHIIVVSDSKLISIGGGKWTTYRQMAEETVDTCISQCNLQTIRPCVTTGLLLEGAHTWDPLEYIKLVQDYGLEVDVAQHLSTDYGDRAYSVARLARVTGKRWPIAGQRLHPEFPVLEAEVRFACREYACTAVDFIARRSRLAFLNTYAASECLPRVIEIMGEELKWSSKEKQRQLEMAQTFIDTEMGQSSRRKALMEQKINLTYDEMQSAKSKFKSLDRSNRGFVTLNDLRRHFREKGEKIDEMVLHDLLNEVDLNRNGELEFNEFVLLYSGLKGGNISHSRFASLIEDQNNPVVQKRSSLARGGGGV